MQQMHVQAVIPSRPMTNIGLHLVAFQVCRKGRRLEFASHSTWGGMAAHHTLLHSSHSSHADAAGTMSVSSAPFTAQSLMHAVTVNMESQTVYAATLSEYQTELRRY